MDSPTTVRKLRNSLTRFGSMSTCPDPLYGISMIKCGREDTDRIDEYPLHAAWHQERHDIVALYLLKHIYEGQPVLEGQDVMLDVDKEISLPYAKMKWSRRGGAFAVECGKDFRIMRNTEPSTSWKLSALKDDVIIFENAKTRITTTCDEVDPALWTMLRKCSRSVPIDTTLLSVDKQDLFATAVEMMLEYCFACDIHDFKFNTSTREALYQRVGV